MTSEEIATTQAQLTRLALASLDVVALDSFIETTSGSSPAVEAAEFRELAIAVANLQRVAHRQLGIEGVA